MMAANKILIHDKKNLARKITYRSPINHPQITGGVLEVCHFIALKGIEYPTSTLKGKQLLIISSENLHRKQAF